MTNQILLAFAVSVSTAFVLGWALRGMIDNIPWLRDPGRRLWDGPGPGTPKDSGDVTPASESDWRGVAAGGDWMRRESSAQLHRDLAAVGGFFWVDGVVDIRVPLEQRKPLPRRCYVPTSASPDLVLRCSRELGRLNGHGDRTMLPVECNRPAGVVVGQGRGDHGVLMSERAAGGIAPAIHLFVPGARVVPSDTPAAAMFSEKTVP